MRFLVGDSAFFAQLHQLLFNLYMILAFVVTASKLLKVELGIHYLRPKKNRKRPVRQNLAKKKRSP
jgi:hypothetical protein